MKDHQSASLPSWRHCILILVAATAFSPWRQARAFVHTGSSRCQRSIPHTVRYSASLRMQDDISTNIAIDPISVREYTQEAIHHRGEPRGLEALEKLGKHCAMRTPFDFDNNNMNENKDTVVAPQKGLIPPSVTEEFLRQVYEMEQKGWLSTNPDSVDGLPSLHLNLVSGGKPVVQGVNESQLKNEFQQGLQALLSTVQPYIYDKLLSTVQELTNDSSIRVSDVFLRRYGDDIAKGTSRNGISAHYDVFSKVTSVIAMDNTASEGTDGLYTTEMSKEGSTSNNASLRRFFPLERGDAVVHTWDVLHGVHVSPNTDRTSLIVWFTTDKVLESKTDILSPWLTDHPDIETNDVAQFVLASALTSTDNDDESTQELVRDAHDLYLKSAASGNTFALTRLGSLAQERELSLEHAMRGLAILNNLRPSEDLPFDEQVITNDYTISYDTLAKRFWFEGAVRGNPMAQAYLADEVMELAANTNNADMRVLAAVLFGLAAQQGHDTASESLCRVVEFEVASNSIQSHASPVVKMANVALR